MFFILKVSLVLGVLVFFWALVAYNKFIIKLIENATIKTSNFYYKLLGRKVTNYNKKLTRTANLNKSGYTYKIYNYFNTMLVDLDMVKYDVTVTGLVIFIIGTSLLLSFLTALLLNAMSLMIFIVPAYFYLVMVLFRFMALMKYEKREAEIMDAIDLLVSDIKGGVYNAITRYKNSFHPNIRGYFLQFLDDIDKKGYSFKNAMVLLNQRLGDNFTDFAHKAIMYEEKADSDMEDIFSSIIEVNRQRRTLRYINGRKFADLRFQFLVSMVVIAGYAMFSMFMDEFMVKFFTTVTFGKLLIIVDIVYIAGVLAYLSSLKSKSL